CQDVALLTQAMVLTAKAPQFLPLSACRPVNALAGIPLGLIHPSGKRLCGWLELTRQLFGRASRSHQIDHLSPELRRISGSVAGHQTPQKSTSRVSTKPGQLHGTTNRAAVLRSKQQLNVTGRRPINDG